MSEYSRLFKVAGEAASIRRKIDFTSAQGLSSDRMGRAARETAVKDKLLEEGLRQQKLEDERKRLFPDSLFGGETLSAPKPKETSLNTPTKTQKGMSLEDFFEKNRSLGAPVRDFFRQELGGIGRFLFGESEDAMRGKVGPTEEQSFGRLGGVEEKGIIDSFKDSINNRGVVRFLYQNVLKEKPEKIREGSAELMRQGYKRLEADNLSTQYYEGDRQNLPSNVTSQLNTLDINTKAWALVELIDIIPVIRAGTKTLSQTFIRSTITEALKATTSQEARAILGAGFQSLKGTKELDDIIALVQQAKDPAQAEKLFRQIADQGTQTPVTPDTIAQRVVYEQGIPILRGADNSNLQDTLKFRETQRDILSGGATKADGTPSFWTAGKIESSRLSVDQIWASERKAGTVALKQSPNEKVNVFIPDTGFTGSLLKPGARVALTEQAVKEGLQASKTKMLQVFPDQLVRLPDGTFVYAPREVIGKNITPTLQGIRAEKAQKVADAERKLQEGNLKDAQVQRQRVEERRKLVEEVAEKAREKAIREKAVMDERRSTAIAKANKVVESNRELRDTSKAEARQATKQALDPLQEERVRLTRNLRRLTSKTSTATDKAKTFTEKLANKKASVRAKYEARIAKAKDPEKAVALRKQMEAELDSLIETQTKLLSERDRVARELEELKAEFAGKQLDKKINKLKAESKAKMLEIQDQSVKELREAKRVLRETKDENFVPEEGVLSGVKLGDDVVVTRLKDDFIPEESTMNVGEIKKAVKSDYEEIAKELGDETFEVIDVEVIGSRVRGTSRADSDLDIVVSYKGEINEELVSDFVRNSDFNTGNEIHSKGELSYGDLYTDITATKKPIEEHLKKDLLLQKKSANKVTDTPPPKKPSSSNKEFAKEYYKELVENPPAIYREDSQFHADTAKVTKEKYIGERISGIGSQRTGNKKLLEVHYNNLQRIQKRAIDEAPKPDTAPDGAKVATEPQPTPIAQAEKATRVAEENLHMLETSRKLLRESIDNNPAKELANFSKDKFTSLAQRGENRAVSGKLRDKDSNFIRRSIGEIAKDLGYKDLDDADEALTSYRASKVQLKELDEQVKTARADLKQAKKFLAGEYDTEMKQLEESYGQEIAEGIRASQRLDEVDTFLVNSDELATGSTRAETSAGLSPIEAGGTKIARTATNKKTVAKLENILDDLKADELGMSVEELRTSRDATVKHAVAENKTQAINAVKYVVETPAEAYDKIMGGSFSLPGTSRAAVMNALLDSPYVKGDAIRELAITKQMYKDGTRLGQELQARVLIRDTSFAGMMNKLYEAQAVGLNKIGGDDMVKTEVEKIIKELGDEFDNMKLLAKDDMAKAIDNITC